MGILDGIRQNGDQRIEEVERNRIVERDILTEHIRALELAFEESGWREVGAAHENEWTRQGLDDLMRVARVMYISHPLIKRAVNVTSYYTFGQGITVQAADKTIQEQVIEPLMQDDYNRCEVFSQVALLGMDVDQHTDGNLFIAMFTDPSDGSIDLITVPPEQITEVIHKEGDRRVVTFYRRKWMERTFDEGTGLPTDFKEKEALYPDWRYRPTERPSKMGDIEIYWDAPIVHNKTGGLRRMDFGMPEVYAAMSWARAYKGFLEDWHTIVKALSKFAWEMKAKGGKQRKNLRKKLQGTAGENEGDSTERNPAPAPGGVYIAGEADSIRAIPKSDATIQSDDARPSRLMVAAASDLPDTILSGDVDIGNFATSKTLDRPTELKMRNRQIMWMEVLQDIFRYAIEAKVRYGGLGGSAKEDGEYGGEVQQKAKASRDESVEVTFPPILEDDKEANIKSIVAAATLSGSPTAGTMPEQLLSKLLLEALEVDDVEKALTELPEQEQVKEAVEDLAEAIRARG